MSRLHVVATAALACLACVPVVLVLGGAGIIGGLGAVAFGSAAVVLVCVLFAALVVVRHRAGGAAIPSRSGGSRGDFSGRRQ